MKRLFMVLATLTASAPGWAEDPVLKADSAPGRAATVEICSHCHSSAYIVMNSVFLSADDWRAEVLKMRTAFGASIDEKSADEISAYLGQHYGVPDSR